MSSNGPLIEPDALRKKVNGVVLGSFTGVRDMGGVGVGFRGTRRISDGHGPARVTTFTAPA